MIRFAPPILLAAFRSCLVIFLFYFVRRYPPGRPFVMSSFAFEAATYCSPLERRSQRAVPAGSDFLRRDG